jgi:hypothetical protein
VYLSRVEAIVVGLGLVAERYCTVRHARAFPEFRCRNKADCPLPLVEGQTRGTFERGRGRR